jgi:Fe-S cluster assembly ATP-binding protein
MLELQDICFSRDNKEILKNVNLKIDNEKMVVITGPNGSGKSTLAKIIMGIEKPDSGKIIFDGKDITKLSITDRAKSGIGFAFQQPVRFKGLTVKDLIEISAGNSIKLCDACDVLADVGLCAQEYLNREVNSELSGGELKRIEIAMLAAKKSKLTIFDEPEAGIDLWSFNNLISVFEKMHDDIKGSIVIISHQERILNIADEIVLISNGRVEKHGPKEEVLPKIFGKVKPCHKLENKERCSKGGTEKNG